MSVEELAHTIYREFKLKPESQHIATEFALLKLAKTIETVKPKNVLEIGAGIGTITKLLLLHPDRPQNLTVTEANPVCLFELAKNLAGVDLSGFSLIRSSSELDTSCTFDLVIFDGILDSEKQYEVLRQGTWFFVEGSRSDTISELRQKLAARALEVKADVFRPGGNKLKFWSKRRLFGVRIPALKIKPIKGCSVGQVLSQKVVA